MKNYILLLGILLFTSCKTKEDYSKYTYIDEGIESDKYEISTIFPKEVELFTIFGPPYASDPRTYRAEEINQMPLIAYDQSNFLYFRYKNNNKTNDFKYNMSKNMIDTLSTEDMNVIRNSYAHKENKFVNFKFPEAEEYYKVIKKEYYSEISEEEKKRVLEEYKDSKEEIKQAVIETRSLRYNITYAELQMPKEKIHFKFNCNLNKNIELFGNEELYKKGYMYIYIFYNLDMFPHSGGLYVIRPKAKK
ncbi:hypothetical protein [Apibacter adventoris]|uniref:Uncharacterized protein n=1 Tax=Apibacter adventoris TaxID=1679466 RepID=A0A2S8AEE9_9FLAO|nr:hypothetical protein [Apibacter adventoris]PQL93413.1 hypothetical protein C4S77_04510 [Apibacter adventoris]